MKETELKHEVLMVLIRVAVDIMPGAEIIPSTYIAKLLNKPIRDIRKVLKELEAEGFIRYGYEGGWNEYSERPFCVWGYCITKKAMELPEYKEAEEAEERLIQEIWFGGSEDERWCGVMAKILKFPPPNYPLHKASFVDYKPSDDCCNDDSFGQICVKCGKCGRKFSADGFLEKGGE